MDTGGQNGSGVAFATVPRAWSFTNTFTSGRCCPRFSYGNVKHSSPMNRRMRRSLIQAVQKESRPVRKVTPNTDENGGWHPLFLKHIGTWEGHYRKVDPNTGETTDTHRSKVVVGVRGDRYSQKNTYTWDDGRVEEYIFPGCIVDGQFVIESARLTGISIVLLEDAHVFYAKFKERPGDVIDTIRLLSPTKRARTWQVSDGNDIVQIVHAEEERISSENAYFEISDTPWDS